MVVVVVVVGVAAWAFLYGPLAPAPTNGNGDGNGDGDGDGNNVADAESLRFSVDVTAQGTTGTYRYAARNVGTDDLMLRIDIVGDGEEYAYILNGAEQKAWAYADDEWTDVSEAYQQQWDAWNPLWQQYHTNLAQNWAGTGDYTYTSPQGETVRVYNVEVNPALPDSLFQPS